MFKIYDGREHFYQWDLDRKLIVSDASITQVHFCNRTDDCSLVCETYTEDGLNLVNVPNVLLQDDWRINVYAYDHNYTKHSTQYDVIRRSKPDSYVYTETETLNFNTLADRIAALEEGGGGGSVDVDLSNYYTKEEVDDAIANIDIPDVDLSDYYTKSEVNAQNKAFEDSLVANYYNKIEVENLIPDTSGFATMEQVEAKGYQTAEQVIALVNSKMPMIVEEVAY